MTSPSPMRRWVAELTEEERRAFIRVGLECWEGKRPADRLAVAAMQEIVQFGAAQKRAEAEIFGRLEAEHRAEVERIAEAVQIRTPEPPGHTLIVNADDPTDFRIE